MKIEYWLVSLDKDCKPFSLVKTYGKKALVMAGHNKSSAGFTLGTPNTLLKTDWLFELLTNISCHPVIGEWIDQLGTVTTPAMRLKKERKRRRAIERAKNLIPEQLEKIRQLRRNGVTYKKIAEMFDISAFFARKTCS